MDEIKSKIIEMIKNEENKNKTHSDTSIALRDLYIFIEEEIEKKKQYDIIDIIDFIDNIKNEKYF